MGRRFPLSGIPVHVCLPAGLENTSVLTVSPEAKEQCTKAAMDELQEKADKAFL
ncbi:hypothetical protein [Streptomyces venezuelae]|uniref:hypothetical protein n=1 Tax=Streptomyces venezuelae TaxID=54571 RepID=UPI0016885BC0|nr:hypothetical protein [Streptomyces venezuelae]